MLLQIIFFFHKVLSSLFCFSDFFYVIVQYLDPALFTKLGIQTQRVFYQMNLICFSHICKPKRECKLWGLMCLNWNLLLKIPLESWNAFPGLFRIVQWIHPSLKREWSWKMNKYQKLLMNQSKHSKVLLVMVQVILSSLDRMASWRNRASLICILNESEAGEALTLLYSPWLYLFQKLSLPFVLSKSEYLANRQLFKEQRSMMKIFET